jgi:hypothetical protein
VAWFFVEGKMRPITRRKLEAATRRRLRSRVGPSVRAATLYDALLKAIAAEFSKGSSKPALAQTNLLDRLADELRTMTWCVEVGYVLPAMTLGAGIIEIGYAAAYIGLDSVRAAEWLSHAKTTGLPWRIKDVIKDVAKGLGHSATQAENLYSHYQVFCTGKHHNPVFTLQVPATLTAEALLIEVDPLVSRRWNTLAGLLVFALYHLNEALRSLREAGGISPRLDALSLRAARAYKRASYALVA